MAHNKDAGFKQYNSPSFTKVDSLTQLARSTSSSASPSVRPPARRSASGNVHSAKFSGLTAVSSPAAALADRPTEDSLTSLQPPAQQRSMTASPSSAFGIGNKVHQSGWSDSSGQTPSGGSSVWNGRASMVEGGNESDAIATATTSTVSTPGRASTMIGTVEIAGGSSAFSRSPLHLDGTAAWSGVKGAASPLGWPQDLSSPSAEYILDPTSSPTAIQKPLSTGDRQRQTVVIAQDEGRVTEEPASIVNDIATSSSKPRQNGGRAFPKRAPVRSTTLDPSHHLPGDRRLAHDEDEDDVDAQADELAGGIRNMTIGNSGAAAQSPQQTMISPVNTNVPLQPQPQHPRGVGYQSPHLFGYAQRPSLSYGHFSPGDYAEPSPYYPNKSRSPDAYAPYPGVGPMFAGMGGMPVIDMSGYESYRTTPDPYAPPVPGRPVFISPGGPGSQGSTPQSPSFGPSPVPHSLTPAPLRGNEAMFYPGPVGPYGGPPQGSRGMHSPVRPMMQHVSPQYAYRPASDSRSIPQSPLLGAANHGPPAMIMSPSSQMMYAPQSLIMPGQVSPDLVERGPSQGQAHQYVPGIHRRVGSNLDGFGPAQGMQGRPPFALGPHPGFYIPGQAAMPAFPNNAFNGPSQGWNGRFPDHRRVPTGPGGVMAPPMGFGGAMNPAMGGAGGFVRLPYGAGGFYNGSDPVMAHSTRSPLLEEFRSRHTKNRKFELRDIFGSIIEFSGDQHGSRFIQERLDTATEEEKEKVFEELVPSARQLMTDVFGNYVIQKMLEHGSDPQRSTLAKEMEGHVLTLSLGTYGCRVVQKAFDHTDQEQRVRLAKELDGHIMQCVKDQNANHVVQKIIERLDSSQIDFIPSAFHGQVMMLAAHCYSCRVLQRIFEHCKEEQSRPLLDELHGDALRLMQDQYGNYVIQWVLQKGLQRDRDDVISKIKGQILPLSRHKFASNVIEQVVRCASEADKAALIDEILQSKTTAEINQQRVSPAVVMMKDQFANYVLQRFIENSQAEQRLKLVTAIRPQLQAIKRSSSGYAKHLAAIERLLDERIEGVSVADPSTVAEI